MGRYRILNEIRTLDPVQDHQRIVFLSTCFEFPFDTTRALEFALYRTYCVSSISGLLDQHPSEQNSEGAHVAAERMFLRAVIGAGGQLRQSCGLISSSPQRFRHDR